LSGEHVEQMANAEAHLGSEGGGEQLLRHRSRVHRLRRREAIVAIAAALGRVLAEMPEQPRAAAASGLDEAGERIRSLALPGLARFLDLGEDPPPRAREIVGAPE